MDDSGNSNSDPAKTAAAPGPAFDAFADTVEAFPNGPAPYPTTENAVPDVRAEAGRRFGRYRIERQLGNGGMGEVYLAHDTQLDRPVALKMPLFDPTAPTSLLERFQREARAAANVNHPNICPVYDVGEQDGRRFISMAYVEGQPLSSYVAVGSRLTHRQIARIVRKIALGIAAAHDSGILHRDIKPDNIIVDGRNEPIVMDFGLARALDDAAESRLTREGTVIGTPAYMAPEQLDGSGNIGPWVDVYALGVVLYELLTGRIPFNGEFHEVAEGILHDEPPPIESLCPDVSPVLASICQRAMSKRPADRFESMQDFARELGVYLKNERTTVEGPRAAVTTRAPAPTREMSFDELPYEEPEEFRPTTQAMPAPRVVRSRKRKAKKRRSIPVGTIVGVIVGGIAIVGATMVIVRMARRAPVTDESESDGTQVAAVEEDARRDTPNDKRPKRDTKPVETPERADEPPPKRLDDDAPVVSPPKTSPPVETPVVDSPKPRPAPEPPADESITIEPFFTQADRNRNGEIDGRELPRHIIERADQNDDLRLTREEFRAGVKRLGRDLLAPPGPGEFRPPGRRPPRRR